MRGKIVLAPTIGTDRGEKRQSSCLIDFYLYSLDNRGNTETAAATHHLHPCPAVDSL